MLPPGFLPAANLTPSQDAFFLRPAPLNGLDAVAFHYSVYRSLTRFLGMDGNLDVAYDVGTNFVSAWNEMFVDNDFLNPATGAVDPKHMYGTSNFDVFRWPSLENGTQRSVLGTFITTLVMPGIPLVCSVSLCAKTARIFNICYLGFLWRRAELLSFR
jgi:alpha-1,3-glucan synthase